MKNSALSRSSNVRSMFYLLLFFIGIGILSLVIGLRNYLHEEAFFANAEQDTATLTDYVPDPNYKTADFCPEYSFTTKAGQSVSYIGDACLSAPDSSKVGQQEQIYIDPKVPQVVESRGWTGSEGSGLIVGIAGFLFFPLIGLINYLVAISKERKKAARANWRPASESSNDDELAQLEQEEQKLRKGNKAHRG